MITNNKNTATSASLGKLYNKETTIIFIPFILLILLKGLKSLIALKATKFPNAF